MKEFIKKCVDCGSEKKINQKNKSKRCKSCAAKERIQKYGNHKGFLKYCQKGSCVGEKNPFYGRKHTQESRLKMSKNTSKEFTKSKEYKEKMSKMSSGTRNPMYGKSVYDVWLSKYGKEKADLLMEEKREKHRISSTGERNPMYGKKSPQGSGNGWSGWYKEWYFRSLRELSYVVNVLEPNGLAWKSAEDIRIKYKDWRGDERTYHPDFLVENKLLVEVKPERLKKSPSVMAKQKSAEKFAKSKGLKYELIDPPMLKEDQIEKMHKEKSIVFIERYELKYKELKSKKSK